MLTFFANHIDHASFFMGLAVFAFFQPLYIKIRNCIAINVLAPFIYHIDHASFFMVGVVFAPFQPTYIKSWSFFTSHVLTPFVNHVDHASLFMIGTAFAFFDPRMLKIGRVSQSTCSHFLRVLQHFTLCGSMSVLQLTRARFMGAYGDCSFPGNVA